MMTVSIFTKEDIKSLFSKTLGFFSSHNGLFKTWKLETYASDWDYEDALKLNDFLSEPRTELVNDLKELYGKEVIRLQKSIEEKRRTIQVDIDCIIELKNTIDDIRTTDDLKTVMEIIIQRSQAQNPQ